MDCPKQGHSTPLQRVRVFLALFILSFRDWNWRGWILWNSPFTIHYQPHDYIFSTFFVFLHNGQLKEQETRLKDESLELEEEYRRLDDRVGLLGHKSLLADYSQTLKSIDQVTKSIVVRSHGSNAAWTTINGGLGHAMTSMSPAGGSLVSSAVGNDEVDQLDAAAAAEVVGRNTTTTTLRGREGNISRRPT